MPNRNVDSKTMIELKSWPIYLTLARKPKWLIRKVQIQGLRSLKIPEFTVVNEDFSDKHNAEVGLFLQPLCRKFTTFRENEYQLYAVN